MHRDSRDPFVGLEIEVGDLNHGKEPQDQVRKILLRTIDGLHVFSRSKTVVFVMIVMSSWKHLVSSAEVSSMAQLV